MSFFGSKPGTPSAAKPLRGNKKLLDKRIPTIAGVAVLVFGLIAGGVLFSQGTAVFSPRATPQTTPKSIKITNLTESSFTVTYLTDAPSEGIVKYGTDPETPNSRSAQVATDDRVQLGTSTTTQFNLHHITIRGLQPKTTYHYIISASGSEYDNNGQPFSITTAERSGAPTAAKTIYGSVSNQTGTPAEGAIVYVSFENAGLLSSLVKQSGSWAVPLSNARTPDGTSYAQVTDETLLAISVQGLQVNSTTQASLSVAEAQPVAALTLGDGALGSLGNPSTATESGQALVSESENTQQVASSSSTPEETTQPLGEELPEPDAMEQTEEASESSQTSLLAENLGSEPVVDETESLSSPLESTESAAVTVVDTTIESHQVIHTQTPVITGTAAPNVVITITVNSETQITQQLVANPDGTFELDLEKLKKELEPGEHTVSYSYTDPQTGQLVNKTITFTVTGTENQLAQASTTQSKPYGSGNPVPLITTPSPSPIIASSSASPSPIASATATPSTRSALPSTASGIPTSGSVGTTFTLVFGGLFFIISGVWSFWIAQQVGSQSKA